MDRSGRRSVAFDFGELVLVDDGFAAAAIGLGPTPRRRPRGLAKPRAAVIKARTTRATSIRVPRRLARIHGPGYTMTGTAVQLTSPTDKPLKTALSISLRGTLRSPEIATSAAFFINDA